MIEINADVLERFWDKVEISAPDECWEWVAGTSGDGYGAISINNEAKRAPRVSWVIHNDKQIPRGMLILHTCDNPPCVNPQHLRVGTHEENYYDAVEKGRMASYDTPVGVVCAFCWGAFKVKPSRFNENNFCSQECVSRFQEKINWPEMEILLSWVVDSSFSEVGRKLGVSDNAVRKRLQNHLGWCPTYTDLKHIRNYGGRGPAS